jgi:hypothetical protein
MAGPFGTLDTPDTATPSRGLRLAVEGTARTGWFAAITSGPLSISNRETHLGKITLAFDLSASRALPVRVTVRSYDSERRPTGALETLVFPAAADFYQRHALDLSDFTPAASSASPFDPAAPFIGFEFALDSTEGWPAVARHELRLDNLHYATPAYYVAPSGDDAIHDGRSPATAFATPQRALDAARPGDIIVLLDGAYHAATPPTLREKEKPAVARFVRPGRPGAWITLKNHPGHHPRISARGRDGINISRPPADIPEADEKMSYVEVRGLHIRGNADTARAEFPEKIGTWAPETNAQGIVVNGRFTPHPGARGPGEIVHHIRLADNLVELCAGDGIYIEYADWLQVERNRVRDNCHVTIGYAPAGLAVMGYANFDASDDAYKMLLSANEASGNRLEVPNAPFGKRPRTGFFNGNGFLFDANAETPSKGRYLGRTLVQNNLAHHNGAAGLQIWGNHRMDVIHNTVYLNATVLPWGEVGFERSRDIRFVNNLVVARATNPLDTWQPHTHDRRAERVLRLNNLYWGGLRPPVAGVNDLVAEPRFLHASADPATADFRLQPDSPGLSAARWETFSPPVDFAGRRRPASSPADLGAFQH